jgi:hypothetical protein
MMMAVMMIGLGFYEKIITSFFFFFFFFLFFFLPVSSHGNRGVVLSASLV